MRDSSHCARLRALPLSGYWSRRRGRWPFLLLCPLRTARNQGRCERPSRLAFGDLYCRRDENKPEKPGTLLSRGRICKALKALQIGFGVAAHSAIRLADCGGKRQGRKRPKLVA